MQLLKRLTAGMLALILCLSLLPTQANAQQHNDVNVSMGDDLNFHSTNGFGALLGAELSQTQAEEAASGDCGISDLTFAGQIATVEYFTDEDAVLTVAVYTEDYLQMITSATVEVGPENDIVEVTFREELPEYFTASAFLMDGYDFSPLCPTYSTSMYTKNMQDLLASTVEDYDPELILNLDDDNTTNFAVYNEGTKILPYQEGVNRVVTADHENHIYVIENADSNFTSLKEGDVFSYAYAEGEYLITKVGSITVQGTTVTITGAELELEEVFSQVKVEYDASKGEVQVDTSTASPYVEFQGVYTPPQTFAWQGGGIEERAFPYKLVEPLENDGKNIKLSGTVTLTLKAEFSFYFSWGEQRAKVELSASLDLSATLEAKIELFEIPLGYWYYGIPGLYIDFSPKLVLSLEGKVSVGGAVSFSFGVEYDDLFGLQKLDTKPVWDISKVEAEATFFFGVDFSPEAVIIEDDIASLQLGATVGLEVKASLKGSATLEPKTTPPERHACKACIDIQPKLVFTISGECNVLDWDRLSIKLTLGSWARNFQTMYYSIDKAQLGVGQCPNREYLVTFETFNSDNEHIRATITGQYGNIYGTTNEEGSLQIYMRAGTQYLNATTLDMSAKTRITVPRNTKAVFTLSKDPTGSVNRPGYQSGGGIGGALGQVETENLVPNQPSLPADVIAAGECGLDTYWQLKKDGKLRIYGNGLVLDYSDMEPYYEDILEVEFEHGITEIANYPLSYWPNVTSMTLAGTVQVTPWCFRNSQSLKSVRMIRGIREVGEYAFYGCSALQTAILPDTLETIGPGAFSRCSTLNNVKIPSSVTSIGYEAFCHCISLEKITIPSGVQEIGRFTFLECSSLKDVYIPNSVTTIGDSAFAECKALTSIVVPDSVTTMDESVFSDCSSLQSVTLSANLTSIGRWLFNNCTGLTRIVLPDACIKIPDGTFMGCENLSSITLGNSLTSIGEYVFSGCSSLTEIILGKNLAEIGETAFAHCTNLKRIVFKGSAPTINFQAFYNVEASVYYPANDPTWTADKIASYDSAYGIITWLPYTLDNSGNMVVNEAAAVTYTADPAAEAPVQPLQYNLRPSDPEIPDVTDAPALFSIHGGQYGTEDAGTIQVNVASFTGLVPGADYILLALAHTEVENPLDPTNLLYIDQAAAAADGTLKFRYIPRVATDLSYVFACGPNDQDLEDAVITFPTMYASEQPRPVIPTVTYHGNVLTEGIDYEISGEAGYTEAGNYTCILRGIYDYSGEVSCTYTVQASSHTHTGGTATCTELSVCTTCGKAYGALNPTNHSGMTELRNASAYSCTKDGYSGDVYCLGCGQIKTKGQILPKAHRFENGICGICNTKDPAYNDSTSTPEKDSVARVFGADRYLTAFKAADMLKAELNIQKFQNIIVASGTDFPDALAGSYLAAMKNAPILLVRNKNVNDVKAYIQRNLNAGGTVYLLGGINAVPKSMETGLNNFRIMRLGGATRYDTNLLILKEAGIANKDIIVCTGTNFADSLSASATGLPILLVKNRLNDAQKDFLRSTSGKKIIVGGTVAVNTTVEKQLAAYGQVTRLAGVTRYQTSVLVAEAFFSNPDTAVLAYAQNFPDGLSGGPLAYTLKAPLILTATGKEALAVKYTTDHSIRSGYVLGGTGLISDKVVKKVFSMTASDSILIK